MTILSPAKILVVLVVAVVFLGPDKLPKVARQVGALWGDFRRLRHRLESDVRGNFPDLPSTDAITQAVRSPISFLDSLADTHASERTVPDLARADVGADSGGGGGGAAPPGGSPPESEVVRADSGVGTTRPTPVDPTGTGHRVRSEGRAVPDDPSMN